MEYKIGNSNKIDSIGESVEECLFSCLPKMLRSIRN